MCGTLPVVLAQRSQAAMPEHEQRVKQKVKTHTQTDRVRVLFQRDGVLSYTNTYFELTIDLI